ncbi:transcriptional regulator [Solibacillus sp. R5-41]|uniref:MurR/RpiR family transcriptional regulator n=1 Tax=Solibacillus sp. R5-41 TaxID=2048654 RepID=UPI000C128327|nr:MurR/RpiR family transcriptional regulator [Solibacillus sp. R5-41]ATP39836.1 transcriptional regulator [Solibacillus sp. R5-41]
MTIKERIEQHFFQLSKSQQKVATVVLNNPAYISTHAAAEIGQLANTSETTVIRFCYAVGLTGFAQLQKEITRFLVEDYASSTLGNYVSSKEALFKEQALCEKVMRQSSAKVVKIAEQMDEELFKNTTKAMHDAKKIYIAGVGASQFGAQWLHYTLNMLRPGVELIVMETSALIRKLQEIDETTLVLIISLHRYYNDTLQLAQEVLARGAKVIGITDSNVASLHEVIDTCFVLEQKELSTIDLMPALVTFMNSLIVGMMSHDVAYYNEQRLKFDDFQTSFIANRWR